MFPNRLNTWLKGIALLLFALLLSKQEAQAQCTFSATVQGSGAGYTTIYRLTDSGGTVVDDTAPFTTPTATPTGTFRLYAITYDNANPPTGIALAIGSNVSAVSGGCSDIDWIPAICRCESETASVTVGTSGYQAANTQTYALMNGGTISAANTSGLFTAAELTAAGLTAGTTVRIYAVNHDATAAPMPAAGVGLPTSGCYDADSYALVGAYSCCSPEAGTVSQSPNPACTTSGITVSTSGNNATSEYSTQYYIVNNANLVAFGPQAGGSFGSLAAGTYQACVVNYKNTAGNPVTALTNAPAAGANTTSPNCYEIACVSFTVVAPATSGTPTNTSACNNSAGLIDLYNQLSGETAGGTWSVTSGTPGPNFVASSGILNPNGLAAGTYEFTYTVNSPAPCANPVPVSVTVTITAAPNAGTANVAPTVICSTAATVDLFGLLSGEQSGGTWTAVGGNPPGGTFNAAAGSFNPAGASGSYLFTYTINGAGACAGSSDSETVEVSVVANPSAGTAVTGTTRCNSVGSPLVNLYALLPGASLGGTWATSGSPVAPPSNFFSVAGLLDPTNLAAGTYSFTYTVSAPPCATASNTVSVTISDQPDAGTGSSVTVCNDNTASISLAGLLTGEDAGGTWSASGSNPAGGTFNAGAGTFAPTAGNSGTYQFTYTLSAAAPCVTDAETVSIVVNPVAAGTATPASAEVCSGETINFALNANLPATFAWAPASLPAGITAPSGSGATISGMVTNSGAAAATISYTVTVTTSFGCTSTFSVPVTINAIPAVSATSTDVACRGDRTGTATATVTGGETPYGYLWNSLPAQFNATAVGLYASTYTVTVTDNNGCTNTASTTVNQPATGVSVDISQVAPITCFGGTTSLSATGSGGTGAITYAWSTGATTTTITGAAAGAYSVTATDAVGCPAVDNYTLLQPTQVMCPFSVQPATCGDNNGTATVSPSGGTPGYTYSWSNGNTTATATGLAVGTYSVTVADANSCTCVATGISIANEASPIITSSVNTNEGNSGGTSPFAYNTHVFTIAGGTAPYSFDWDNMGYVRYDIQYTDTGATVTIYYNDNATWAVTVSDANGCTGPDLEIHNDNSSADVQLDITNYAITGQSGTGAPNGAIDITVGGGGAGCAPYTYLWSNGATTEDITGLVSGWYNVVVTCADGSDHTEGWYWVPQQRRGRNKVENDNTNLSVMPNPFANETTVTFSTAIEGMTNVSLYSVDGKQIATLYDDIANADVVYAVQISGGNLPAGLYTVVLRNANGDMQYYKVVLTK